MKKTRLMSLLLSMVLLFTNTVVFTIPTMAAEEVEGVSVAIDGESATMTFTSSSFSPYIVARTATTYTVTVTGGTASPAGPYTVGTKVTVTATPPANMGFKQWNGLDGVTFVDDTNKQSATATFKMPARAVEATAVYGRDHSEKIYSLSVSVARHLSAADHHQLRGTRRDDAGAAEGHFHHRLSVHLPARADQRVRRGYRLFGSDGDVRGRQRKTRKRRYSEVPQRSADHAGRGGTGFAVILRLLGLRRQADPAGLRRTL